MAEDAWLFGYGSLMWRPGFEFVEAKIGFVRGWSRRFYQGSTDHRGVPGKPGRVVTLVQENDGSKELTWGVAYRISAAEKQQVFGYLDHREKGGYSCQVQDFFTSEGNSCPDFQVTFYVALPTNPEYLGPAPLVDAWFLCCRSNTLQIAKQIASAEGPSGPNIEYLASLASTLRRLNVHEEHVFQLESLAAAVQVQS